MVGGKPMRVVVICSGRGLSILAETVVAQALFFGHLHDPYVQGKIM
jgi:predicted phosphodiesterase